MAFDIVPNFGKNIILKYKGNTAPSLWGKCPIFNTIFNDKESKSKGLCSYRNQAKPNDIQETTENI